MRKILLVFTFFCLTIRIYGQSDVLSRTQDTVFIKYNKDWTSDKINYISDTVIFETGMRRHILKGTAILPFTSNQQEAKGYGMYFDKVNLSDCRRNGLEYESIIHKYINYVIQTDSSLIVDINFYDNCCYSFLCDISVVDESILNLIYTGYGTFCDCDCCFGLNYQFSLIKNASFSKIKYIMINGNRKTKTQIGYLNKK